MKFFVLILIFLHAEFVFAKIAQRDEVKIRKQKTVPALVLGRKKVKNNSASVVKKIDSQNSITIDNSEIAPKVDVEQYKKITRKKQDWKEHLKNLTKDISTLEAKIMESKDRDPKDEDAVENYTKQLYELKYYRSIVNTHLKNYGKAIAEAKEVVQFDESYLLLKPVMFFNKTISLDGVMKSVWSLLKTAEENSCNNASECLQDVGERYSTKWHEGSHDYTKYESAFFNNSSFADIKTVIGAAMGTSSCVGMCLIGVNTSFDVNRTEVLQTGVDTQSPPPPPPTTFCSSFETSVDKYSLYSLQITRMNVVLQSATSTAKVHAYLCRGFTNVMMLESGINANSSYIANAKNDIKSAIVVNETLPVIEQLDEIDDVIDIDALFGKYNSVITKDMTNEDKDLAQYAISQQGLNELKTSLEANSADIESMSGISEYLTDEQKTDIAAAYSKYSIADPYGDPQVQTASITAKSNRATAQQGLDFESNLQDFLDAIIDLQKNGDL